MFSSNITADFVLKELLGILSIEFNQVQSNRIALIVVGALIIVLWIVFSWKRKVSSKRFSNRIQEKSIGTYKTSSSPSNTYDFLLKTSKSKHNEEISSILKDFKVQNDMKSDSSDQRSDNNKDPKRDEHQQELNREATMTIPLVNSRASRPSRTPKSNIQFSPEETPSRSRVSRLKGKKAN